MAVGHARSVERSAGAPFAVEKNQASSTLRAARKQLHTFISNRIGGCAGAEQIRCCFCHDDPHDGLAMPGARNRARFDVGVTAATNQRRITNPAGKFAASPSGGSGGGELAARIARNGADGAVLGFEVGCGLVPSFAAGQPSGTLAFDDQFGGITKRDAIFLRE